MRLVREPLVHFLALGALIFALHTAFGAAAPPDTDSEIVVDDALVRTLSVRFRAQWTRTPSRAELKDAVERHVREEVLYREALRLGLDNDDSVVRRRMAQKMEFLAADAAESAPPSEKELRAFYDAHPEAFTEPRRVSLRQVFFSGDTRGQRARDDAAAALAAFQAKAIVAKVLATRGDRSALLPAELRNADPRRLAASFGDAFAKAIGQMTKGDWTGPIPSAYGFHLVAVDAITPVRRVAFDSARADVKTEVEVQRRKQANEALYRGLRAKYHVRYQVSGGVPLNKP